MLSQLPLQAVCDLFKFSDQTYIEPWICFSSNRGTSSGWPLLIVASLQAIFPLFPTTCLHCSGFSSHLPSFNLLHWQRRGSNATFCSWIQEGGILLNQYHCIFGGFIKNYDISSAKSVLTIKGAVQYQVQADCFTQHRVLRLWITVKFNRVRLVPRKKDLIHVFTWWKSSTQICPKWRTQLFTTRDCGICFIRLGEHGAVLPRRWLLLRLWNILKQELEKRINFQGVGFLFLKRRHVIQREKWLVFLWGFPRIHYTSKWGYLRECWGQSRWFGKVINPSDWASVHACSTKHNSPPVQEPHLNCIHRRKCLENHVFSPKFWVMIYKLETDLRFHRIRRSAPFIIILWVASAS